MTKRPKKIKHPAPHRTVEQYEADKLIGHQPVGKPVDIKN